MKLNKKKLPIIFFSIIFIFLFSLFLYVYIKNNVFNKENKNIITRLEYKKIVSNANNLFLVSDFDDNMLIIDDQNNIIKELGNGDYNFIQKLDEYYIISDDTSTIVYDFNWNEILKEDGDLDSIVDEFTKKKYYYFNNYDEYTAVFYNQDFEKINKFTESYISYNDYILNEEFFFGSFIYNSSFEKIGEYDYIINDDNLYYVIDETNKICLIIDTKTKDKKIYNIIELDENYNFFTISDGKETITYKFYDLDLVNTKINKVNLYDNIYADLSSCEVGGILKSEDGTIIDSECRIYKYEDSEYHNFKLIRKYTLDYSDFSYLILFKNGEKKEVYNADSFTDKYLKTYNYENGVLEYTYYDQDGNEIEFKYDNIFSISDEYYYSVDNYDLVLLNKSFEKMYEFKQVDNVECNLYKDKPLCIVKSNKSSGIFYDNDWLIDLGMYFDITLYDNNYFLLYGVDGYSLLNLNNADVLNKEVLFNGYKNYYETVNIEEIVNNYELDKELISNNLTFFKKYAYVVLNNSNLKGYERYIFNLFKVLIDNKKMLNENSFLYGLKTLDIEIVEEKIFPENFAGEYLPTDIKILFLKEYKRYKPTIYHELFHFIDYNIDELENENTYKCGENYYNYEHIKGTKSQKDCTLLNIPYSKYFNEGSTELYSSKYFVKGITDSYDKYVSILYALSYIYGIDNIEDMYFSISSKYDLLNLFVVNSGMDYDEYLKMINEFNLEEFSIETIDYLIDVYELSGKKWYEDNFFKFMINSYIYNNDLDILNSNRYNEYLNNSIDIKEYEEKIVNHIDTSTYYDVRYGIVDDEVKLILKTYNFLNKYYAIDYDFEKNKIIDYKKIK